MMKSKFTPIVLFSAGILFFSVIVLFTSINVAFAGLVETFSASYTRGSGSPVVESMEVVLENEGEIRINNISPVAS